MMLRRYLGGGAAVWLALTAVTWAQDAPPPAADPAPAAAPPAGDAVGQFDVNGDGQLLGQELDRARDFLRALRGVVGDRPREARASREGDGERPVRERGGRGGGRGERGRRGEGPPPGDAPPFEIGDGEGSPRPDGPLEEDGNGPRPPRQRPDQTARLFREFDDNEDGQLNREEFTALMGALRERRGPGGVAGPPEGEAIGPPERPEGRRRGGGDGPPRGRRGDGENGPPRREGRPPRDGEGFRPAPEADAPAT